MSIAFRISLHHSIFLLPGLLSCLLDIPAEQITGIGFPDTFLHGDHEDDQGFDLVWEDRLFSVIRLTDERNCRVYSSKLSFRVLYSRQIENAAEEEKQTDVHRWARLISGRGAGRSESGWQGVMDI